MASVKPGWGPLSKPLRARRHTVRSRIPSKHSVNPRNGQESVIASPRSTLWWASVAHFLNDGLAASLTPLLPLMAADLSLSYSQAGAVKAALNGVTSLSQLPAGFLATRASEATFLGLGLGWFSLSFLLMGLAGGYQSLLLLMASAGLGGGVYHPVGTAWVSRTFLSGRRGAAVGTLNFAGDVGKVLLPGSFATMSDNVLAGSNLYACYIDQQRTKSHCL